MSENTWLAFEPTPSPLPPDWGNGNSYADCYVNGILAGKLYLLDQSTTPPTHITWSAFLSDPRNPHYVPTYYGPAKGGQPGQAITISIVLNGTNWKWMGTETCKWFGMAGSGYWQVTGMNYEAAGYPR